MTTVERLLEHSTGPRQIPVWIASSKRTNECGFLDLPRELRDRIYNFALPTRGTVFFGNVALRAGGPHVWHTDVRFSSGTLQPLPLSVWNFTLALLATSKQLHAETAQILYGGNVFALTVSPSASLTGIWGAPGLLDQLTLPGILPVAPVHLSLLHEVYFQPACPERGFVVKVFTQAVTTLLADVPGAYYSIVINPPVSLGVPLWCRKCEAEWTSKGWTFHLQKSRESGYLCRMDSARSPGVVTWL